MALKLDRLSRNLAIIATLMDPRFRHTLQTHAVNDQRPCRQAYYVRGNGRRIIIIAMCIMAACRRSGRIGLHNAEFHMQSRPLRRFYSSGSVTQVGR
jgi:hypothetical protein